MKYDFTIVLCPWKKIGDQFPQFLNGKYLGGQTRMDAAVGIFQENKASTFILVGGYNEDDGLADSTYYLESQKTTDMRNFLQSKDVSEDKIQVINSLPCTRHNLIAVFNKYKDSFNEPKKNIGILTNFYHLSRVLTFWIKLVEEENEFSAISKNPIPINAESIATSNQTYSSTFEYIRCLEDELNGIKEANTWKYEDGKYKNLYKDKCLTKEGLRRIRESKANELLTAQERAKY